PQATGIGADQNQLLASPYASDPGKRLIGYYCASKLPERAEHIWITNSMSYYKFPPHTGKLSVLVLENPHLFDIGAIQIIPAGEMEPFTIDYAELMASADPGQDPSLSAGDILLGRDLSKTNQTELTPEQIVFLTKAGSKQITVSRGEYQWQGTARPGNRPDFTYDPSSPIVYARTVKTLLDSIHAPTATSELSRIEVRHSDGEVSTFNYLIASSTRHGDLELREGDHIMLHPVTSNIPDNAIYLSRESALFLRPFAVGESSDGVDLAEFIAGVYSDRSSVLPSPDFSNITITREGGTLEVDAHDLSAETPFPLKLGDIVNVPSDGTPPQDWQQFDAAFIEHLQQILPRSAKFQVNSESSRELRVGPQFYQFPITDGMRQINPLATQGDSGFDVLGLSTKAAIRSLGYLPGNQIRINFQQSVGSSWTSSQQITGDFPFPIVEPGDYILINIGSNNSRLPAVPGARNIPIPRTTPTAKPARPVPTKKPSSAPSRRRVILPPVPK
ncbi:MAG: hypothetical protein ACR2RV_23040, partial [Verrucomicrobiales bacterium]